MAKHVLLAVAVVAALCVGADAWGMTAKPTMPKEISNESRWNDLSEQFRKYHSDHTNVFFHLITSPLCILAALSLVNKATNTNMLTKALAVIYCIHLMDKLPLHILATTSFVGTGIALAAANTSSLSYFVHALVRCLSIFYASCACSSDFRWQASAPISPSCTLEQLGRAVH